ncbi:MAG: cell division protein FtsA [Myxococcota bacterium]|jgi:cell division protein FtsA|nr:cell division protein FtsA [Myxococcota bacterium]
MAKETRLAVGVDLGGSSVTAVAVERREAQPVVVALGQAALEPPQEHVGQREAIVGVVRKVIEDAAIQASSELREVFVSLPGEKIKGFNSEGMVEIPKQKIREVRPEHVRRVSEAAQAVSLPQDRRVVHAISREYLLDGRSRITDPIGMSGSCLEARYHLITAPAEVLDETLDIFRQAGLQVVGMMAPGIAAAHAVLTEDEKKLGVAHLDIGSRLTSLVVYLEGGLTHTASLAVGGADFTADLADAAATVPEEAERLKLRSGELPSEEIDPTDVVTLPAVDGRPPQVIHRAFISGVLESRLDDILTFLMNELNSQNLGGKLTAGIVLTGGTALLRGIDVYIGNMLDAPVRIGVPHQVLGLDLVMNPRYATAAGLALVGLTGRENFYSGIGKSSGIGAVWQKTVDFFAELF